MILINCQRLISVLFYFAFMCKLSSILITTALCRYYNHAHSIDEDTTPERR